MNNFVIDINWPSCAGKSTLIKNFLKNKKGIMHINPDKIKWFFNDYLEDKNRYQPILADIVLNMIESALKNNLSVIFDGRPSIDSIKVSEISKKIWVRFYQINVEADYDILLLRFRERIKNVKLEWRVIWNMEESWFKRIYDNYMNSKSWELLLDSGLLSENEMLQKLEEYINSK